MQTQLTNSLVQVRIAENQGEAALARARKQAEQTGRHRRGREPAARPGRPRRRLADLAGRPVRGVGPAPQDPVVLRPAAVRPGASSAEQLSESSQPLVPERVFMAGGDGSPASRATARRGASQGMLGLLINLLVAEKSGFQLSDTGDELGPPGVRRPDGQAGDGIDADGPVRRSSRVSRPRRTRTARSSLPVGTDATTEGPSLRNNHQRGRPRSRGRPPASAPYDLGEWLSSVRNLAISAGRSGQAGVRMAENRSRAAGFPSRSRMPAFGKRREPQGMLP